MKISLIVISIHVLFILHLLYFQTSSKKIISRPHLQVRTQVEAPALLKILKDEEPIPLVTQSVPKEKTSPPQTEICELKALPADTSFNKPLISSSNQKSMVNAPKKNAKKPIIKSSIHSLAEQKLLTENKNQQKLISMMQHSLNTLNTTGKTNSGAAAQKLPGTYLKTLQSETLDFKTNYEEELILYLQSVLSLPEKGEVKLKLTLKREGRVQKIEILKALSEVNKKYVESALSSHTFPTFGNYFKSEKAHTFSITLTSD